MNDSTNQKIFEQIIKTAQTYGWEVNNLSEKSGPVALELSKKSALGEKFSFIAKGSTPAELSDAILTTYEKFDMKKYVEIRKAAGLASERELRNDANSIIAMLQQLAFEVDDIARPPETFVEIVKVYKIADLF